MAATGLAQVLTQAWVATQLPDIGRQLARLATAEGGSTARPFHFLAQVGAFSADHGDRRGGGQMAIELAGGHLAFGLGQQTHHRQISRGQHLRHHGVILIGKKAHIGELQALHPLHQLAMAGTGTHNHKLDAFVLLLQQGCRIHQRDQVMATALVAGIEHGEHRLQAMRFGKAIVGLGQGPDSLRIGPAGDQAHRRLNAGIMLPQAVTHR